MGEHYYSVNPVSEHKFCTFEVDVLGFSMQFTSDAGVFSRGELDNGTRILLEALPILSGRVLDLGCGWGAVGVTLAKKYPDLDVVMTDINLRAVELSQKNLAANGVHAQVLQGDGLAHIQGSFDAVITNPPIRAGKETIYRMFADARDHLLPGGSLYIVIRKQQGAPSALKYLREIYAQAEVIEREAGFWVIQAKI